MQRLVHLELISFQSHAADIVFVIVVVVVVHGYEMLTACASVQNRLNSLTLNENIKSHTCTHAPLIKRRHKRSHPSIHISPVLNGKTNHHLI